MISDIFRLLYISNRVFQTVVMFAITSEVYLYYDTEHFRITMPVINSIREYLQISKWQEPVWCSLLWTSFNNGMWEKQVDDHSDFQKPQKTN